MKDYNLVVTQLAPQFKLFSKQSLTTTKYKTYMKCVLYDSEIGN